MKTYLDILKWGLIEISKSILTKVSHYGLQGKQNLIIRFYNHFDNNFLFEDEFTTVTMQNNNQNLVCNDDSFSINIKVNGFNKRITVPFEAIALVLDPSARFGLELGDVFDQEVIKSPKPSVIKSETIKKLNKNIMIFNENVNINKFNYGGNDYQMDYIKTTRFYLIEVIKKIIKTLPISKNTKGNNLCIEFKKDYPGVIFPHNIEKNKEHLTISLAEKYFNLNVTDEGISVFLSLKDKIQKIFIPYKAITNFFDPVDHFKVDLTFIDYVDEQIIDQTNDQIIFIDF